MCVPETKWELFKGKREGRKKVKCKYEQSTLCVCENTIANLIILYSF